MAPIKARVPMAITQASRRISNSSFGCGMGRRCGGDEVISSKAPLIELQARGPATEMAELDSANDNRQAGSSIRRQVAGLQDFAAGERGREVDCILMPHVAQQLP